MREEKNITLADMHTHSESSHDSVCKIADMYRAQLEKGTSVFAVTDHFDTDSFRDYDVFSPMVKAYDTVRRLNDEHGNENILSGIEISEGFWHPTACERAIGLVPYDVVIGSVHLVRFGEISYAYSQIDFGSLDRTTVTAYLDAYFDDVLVMLETVDFDILAHLTCPLRYINGKYDLGVDISIYNDKIDEILKKVIDRNIALELNTSSFDTLGVSMPDENILKRYFDMGGRLVTLGSDAHIAERASMAFDRAAEQLLRVGFENTYYYKKRKPYSLSINNKRR